MEKLETASTLSVTYANLPVKHCAHAFGARLPHSLHLRNFIHTVEEEFEICENFLLNASDCVYSRIRVRIVDSLDLALAEVWHFEIIRR